MSDDDSAPGLGDIILFRNRMAVVRYTGPLDFTKEKLVGIEIKGTPTVEDGHNGIMNGKQYFHCEAQNHGLFVKYNDITRNIPPEEILDKLAFVYDEYRELQTKFDDQGNISVENRNSSELQQSQQSKECYVNAVTFIGDMFAGAVHETSDHHSLSLKFKQFVFQLLVFQLESTHRIKKELLDKLKTSIDTSSIPRYIKKLTYSYCMNVKQIAPVYKYFNYDFLDEHLNASSIASDKKCYKFMKDFLCHKNIAWIKLEIMLGLFPNLTTLCLAGVVLQDNIFEMILRELTVMRDAEYDGSGSSAEDDGKSGDFSEFYRPEHHRILFVNNIHMLTKIEIIGPEMGTGSSNKINPVNSGLIDSIVERFEMDFENIEWNIRKSSNKWNNEWVSILHDDILM